MRIDEAAAAHAAQQSGVEPAIFSVMATFMDVCLRNKFPTGDPSASRTTSPCTRDRTSFPVFIVDC
ncbi:hypothetical protein E2562_034568 [Oryza meyeriana var. granulata]|uniref:Uncharacterized protein n=1 Tax=Oryza meyeriana var. granulata TaxID=110450 RepID=A0A6G1CVF2_9ORYZ|nr:hypothetical protein E2562_034568 [Oryza meyeriana var. granulata]